MIEFMSGMCWIVASLAILFAIILIKARNRQKPYTPAPRIQVCGERHGKALAGERQWGK